MNNVSVVGLFPSQACLIDHLQARAQELSESDYEKAAKLEKSMKRMMEEDPLMQEESIESYRPRKSLDAHIVTVGQGKNYLLSSCPSTPEKAAALFEVALEKKVSVFVCLLESTEAKEKCNNFWTNRVLSKLPFQSGWKIENVESRVLVQEMVGNRIVKVVESKLQATKELETRTLMHLHLDGWPDGKLVPSPNVLLTMLDRVDELQGTTDTPIQINCRHGEGRTGVVAVLHAIRRDMQEQVRQGKKSSEVKVNVLETTYAMRRQRRTGLLKRKEQLASVYDLAGASVKRLQVK